MAQHIELDFTDLTPDQFVELCADVLGATGFKNISLGGRGPDLGCDILAEEDLVDHTGYSETRRWVVQCKHYAGSGKNVSARDIGDVIGYLATQ
jgi:hypothetical protein